MFDKILVAMIALFLPYTILILTTESHGSWLIGYCFLMGLIAIGCEIYDNLDMNEDDYT